MRMNILPRKNISFSSLNFVLGARRNPIPLCFYLSFSLEGFLTQLAELSIRTEISLSVVTLQFLNVKFSRQKDFEMQFMASLRIFQSSIFTFLPYTK